jgi:hypothetical protein
VSALGRPLLRFRIPSFLFLPHALSDFAVYPVLALTIFSLAPLAFFRRLTPHLVPDLLFNPPLLFFPPPVLLFLLHPSRPFFKPSRIGDAPVVGLLFLPLTSFSRLVVPARCFASCNLCFNPMLELLFSSLLFSSFCLSAPPLRSPLILALLQPPQDLGLDELLVSPPCLFFCLSSL